MASLLPPRELLSIALELEIDALGEEPRLAVHPAWDSISHLDVMLLLERHYGIEITDDTILEYSSLHAIEARFAALTNDD